MFKVHRAALVAGFLACAVAAGAQDRNQQADKNRQQGHVQFNDHDRQVTNNWYKQHQARPVVGFRTQDRLAPDLETRLQVGSILDVKFRSHEHTVPADLRRQLGPAPAGCRYVIIDGHVVLVDKRNQVQDVIHLH
jgi:Ni/Co efflux regulator RcnB